MNGPVGGGAPLAGCPSCQAGGLVLADRILSRLLKNDWPRTVDQLERAALSPRAGRS